MLKRHWLAFNINIQQLIKAFKELQWQKNKCDPITKAAIVEEYANGKEQQLKSQNKQEKKKMKNEQPADDSSSGFQFNNWSTDKWEYIAL